MCSSCFENLNFITRMVTVSDDSNGMIRKNFVIRRCKVIQRLEKVLHYDCISCILLSLSRDWFRNVYFYNGECQFQNF